MKEYTWDESKRFFWLCIAAVILGALSSCSSTAQPFKNYNKLGETYHTVSNDLLHARHLKFVEGSDSSLVYTSNNHIKYSYLFDNKRVCDKVLLIFNDFMEAENFVGIYRQGLVQMSDRLWVTPPGVEKPYLVSLSYYSSKTIIIFKKL